MQLSPGDSRGGKVGLEMLVCIHVCACVCTCALGHVFMYGGQDKDDCGYEGKVVCVCVHQNIFFPSTNVWVANWDPVRA